MVSFILTSRVKDNVDSNIHSLLKSIVFCGGLKDNVEVLIKYDDDDDLKPDKSEFINYPFDVKLFSWNRGEGRFSLQFDYTILLTELNPISKVIVNISDDFIITRPGFIIDLLNDVELREYFVMGGKFIEVDNDNPNINEIINWRSNQSGWITYANPLVASRKLIEVLGGFGFQSNTDNWISLLCQILRYKYNIILDIGRTEVFFKRSEQNEFHKSGRLTDKVPKDNKLYADCHVSVKNSQYFDLVEQQAKNVYLNILDSNKLQDYFKNVAG